MKCSILAKIFALVLMVCFITACAGEGVALLPFISQFSTELDFEGMTFRIRNHGVELDYLAPGTVPTARQELLFERFDEMQTKYNCTIVHSAGDPADYATFYLSGIPEADIVYGQIKYLYQMYSSGYFLNVYDIPNLDLSDGRFGSPEFIETFTLNGELIGIFPQHWGYSQIGFSNAMYYNPEIFKDLAHPNPNELYEQGQWNWAALESIGNACLGASTAEDPLYMSLFDQYFTRMIVLSNGCEYIKIDDNGKYRYALNDPRVTEALQFTHDISKTGCLYPSDLSSTANMDNFVNGLFAIFNGYSGGAFAVFNYQMNGGVGHCYLPDGPNATDNTKGVLSIENGLWCVTREKEDSVDELGNFLMELFAPLDEVAGDWKETFKSENFFDDLSAEVYMTMCENVYFDRVLFAYTDATLFDVLDEAARTGSITENIQSIESVVNQRLDESINAWD